MSTMRIVSWNVNGLRSLAKNGYWDEFLKLDADVYCLQEIKAESTQLPPEMLELPSYFACFNSSKARKGYSGVAVYSKRKPEDVAYGLNLPEFDQEGRLIAAHYDDFTLFNVYFPNGGQGPERLKYKLDFYDAFLGHIEALRKSGKEIIFTGDINTAHEEIDLARPKENEEHTGFLPEERAWLDEVTRLGYIDVFRSQNPTKSGAYTYWDQKTAARDRNVGWRIDYFFVSPGLRKRIIDTKIHTQIYGSDHCPIELELN